MSLTPLPHPSRSTTLSQALLPQTHIGKRSLRLVGHLASRPMPCVSLVLENGFLPNPGASPTQCLKKVKKAQRQTWGNALQ